jgi:hypothetical protein
MLFFIFKSLYLTFATDGTHICDKHTITVDSSYKILYNCLKVIKILFI